MPARFYPGRITHRFFGAPQPAPLRSQLSVPNQVGFSGEERELARFRHFPPGQWYREFESTPLRRTVTANRRVFLERNLKSMRPAAMLLSYQISDTDN